MEHHQIYELWNDLIESNFVTRKLIEVNHLSGGQYSDNNNIRFETRMLKSYLFDCSDAYIIMKRTIDLFTFYSNENDKAQES